MSMSGAEVGQMSYATAAVDRSCAGCRWWDEDNDFTPKGVDYAQPGARWGHCLAADDMPTDEAPLVVDVPFDSLDAKGGLFTRSDFGCTAWQQSTEERRA